MSSSQMQSRTFTKQTWSESVNYKLNHGLSELNWNLEIKQTADRLMPFWYWLAFGSEQNRSGYHDFFLFKSWSGKNIHQWMMKLRNCPGRSGSLCSKMWPASKISIFDAWDFFSSQMNPIKQLQLRTNTKHKSMHTCFDMFVSINKCICRCTM